VYSFDVSKKPGVTPQANAIVYGIKSGLLPASAASDFGEYRMVHYDEEGSIDLLIFEGTPEESVKALAVAGYEDDGKGSDVLRLAVLSSLGSSGQYLLDDIDGCTPTSGIRATWSPSSTTCQTMTGVFPRGVNQTLPRIRCI